MANTNIISKEISVEKELSFKLSKSDFRESKEHINDPMHNSTNFSLLENASGDSSPMRKYAHFEDT